MMGTWWGRRGRILAVVLLAAIGAAGAAHPASALREGVAQGASGGEALVSLDADSTSVNDVLQILAARSDWNIVTSPEVMGRAISIRLRNTPFDEALDLIVRAAGLGYERVGQSILIGDIERLGAPSGLVTRVFDLQYANAQDVKAVLEVLNQKVTANAQGSQLVIRATQPAVENAATIIASLDRKPGQVLLEARLIEVNTSALQELGIDWEKITRWSTVIGEGPFDESGKGQIPDEIDILPFDDQDDIYRQKEIFEVALDALLTDGSARLLSSSEIVTLAGERAEIFAGETVPVVITSLQSPGGAGGVFQTVQLEKIDVGVRLNIVPRVAEDGFITALVEPEVSRILRFVGPDDDLPQTSTRRVRTLVRVRDGERIYLGGLLSEEERRTVKKVPILGQIPLLGYLFQHRTVEKVRLDLVIEITPRIVGDRGPGLPRISPEELKRIAPERFESFPSGDGPRTQVGE